MYLNCIFKIWFVYFNKYLKICFIFIWEGIFNGFNIIFMGVLLGK